MSCTIYISRSLKAQKENNSCPSIFTQLGLKKTISVAAKWITEATTARTPLKNTLLIKSTKKLQK